MIHVWGIWVQPMSLRVSTLSFCFVLALLASSRPVQAETTLLLSNGLGPSSQPQILVSPQQDTRILFKQGVRLNFTGSSVGFQLFPIALSADPQPLGRMALRTGFDTTVVYRQNATATGDNVLFALSNGGGFAPPLFLTNDAIVDTNPDCCYTTTGTNEFVWESIPTPGTPEIYVFRDTLLPVYVANGQDPAVGDSGGGVTFIAYVRNGDVFGRAHSGSSLLSPEETVAALPGASTNVCVEGDLSGTIHAIFVNGSSQYYCNNSGGSFGTPVLVAAVDGPGSLTLAPDGTLVVGYTAAGVTYATERQAGSFTTPVALSPVGVITSEGSVARDSFGYYHATWIDNNELYYHNNVPVPVAEFSADILSGQQGLDVTFTDLSQGLVDSYNWDFGDGETSTEPAPTHRYTTPGLHTVSLTVTGPGGTDTVTKTDYIEITVANHILWLPDLEVLAGDVVMHPILATHPLPMEGFTVAIVYDASFVNNVAVTLAGSLTGPFAPELFVSSNNPNGANSTLVHTVLMEVSPPIDGFAIPPGQRQRISSIEYSVDDMAPEGTVVPWVFTDQLLSPPMDNVFAQLGTSTQPFLDSGSTTVVAAPQNLFIRGDATGDGSVDIADAVAILAQLFNGLPAAGCADGGDANDSGGINIADAVAVLTFLFGGGQQLMYPSPGCGLDPTADNLTCSQSYCP
ncbi:MAG: PKD domain-containing protein [Planctomycetota bacterium]